MNSRRKLVAAAVAFVSTACVSGRPAAFGRIMRINAKYLSIILSFLLTLSVCTCTSRVVYDKPEPFATDRAAVNINTATVAELERLPHIGRSTAEAIVEFRTANGPFRRIEQVMMIRGVSEERFAELRPLLKVE